jgi:hypothetical protein
MTAGLWVLVLCPPGIELARGQQNVCEFVKRFLEGLRQSDREYVLLPVSQWDD